MKTAIVELVRGPDLEVIVGDSSDASPGQVIEGVWHSAWANQPRDSFRVDQLLRDGSTRRKWLNPDQVVSISDGQTA